MLALVSTYHTSKKHHISTRGMLAWILVWIVALCIVWLPDATSMVAQILGIGRGVDVILYSAITLLFFLLFRLHVKLARLESQLTVLVREQALSEYTTTQTKDTY
jgi:hypothetical protein